MTEVRYEVAYLTVRADTILALGSVFPIELAVCLASPMLFIVADGRISQEKEGHSTLRFIKSSVV
jgi:hypothetical protein